jgi:hypothetical protein
MDWDDFDYTPCSNGDYEVIRISSLDQNPL